MARTKRSRRSYGAGEWGRNRVRIFPDPKTGNFQIEWRENGRRRSRSLGHRDWRRAKRQADEFAAGFIGPEIVGKAEAEPEPLTLGTQIGSGVNHGRESSNYLQGRTICALCPSTASAPVSRKKRRSRLKSREFFLPFQQTVRSDCRYNEVASRDGQTIEIPQTERQRSESEQEIASRFVAPTHAVP